MALGICVLSSISVLETPKFSANRVYELLFAEAFTIIERQKSWVFIQLPDSEIQGWIMEGQFELVEEIIPADFIIDEVGGYAVAGENKTMQIHHGSPIPENKSIITAVDNYKILSDLRDTEEGYEEDEEDEDVTAVEREHDRRGRSDGDGVLNEHHHGPDPGDAEHDALGGEPGVVRPHLEGERLRGVLRVVVGEVVLDELADLLRRREPRPELGVPHAVTSQRWWTTSWRW